MSDDTTRALAAQLSLMHVMLAEASNTYGLAVTSCAPAEDVEAIAYDVIERISNWQLDTEQCAELTEQRAELTEAVCALEAREKLIEQYLGTIRGDLYREMCDWIDYEPERKAARQAEWEANSARQTAEFEARIAARRRRKTNPKKVH